MSPVNAVEAVADEGLMTLASRLAESAGCGRARALSRLAGGKNNQVYRVETEAGQPVVLKRYFTDPRDPRDRLRAEWEFMQHAWSRGIHAIPEPLASDPAAQAGLYSFIEGRKLLAAELQPAHIGAAADFVLAMNGRPRAPLAPGSEACFTLAEHIATVEGRVARLATLDTGAPHAEAAQSFVSKHLVPAWTTVKSKLAADAQAAGVSMEEALDPRDRCLSPSDFGFHNALIDEAGRITFLDFEYAGSDDPAKLVSDFFCQPDVAVPLAYQASFIARIADGLGLDQKGRARCCMLLDAYRIKWSCIILNDFLPLGATRRGFADQAGRAARCVAQLAKAETMLAGLET